MSNEIRIDYSHEARALRQLIGQGADDPRLVAMAAVYEAMAIDPVQLPVHARTAVEIAIQHLRSYSTGIHIGFPAQRLGTLTPCPLGSDCASTGCQLIHPADPIKDRGTT